jgi:HEAT repeat protein
VPALAVGAGCAGWWDEVTSRDFTCKSLFVKEDPLVVLRDSRDGDKRAKALRALREPTQTGGSPEDQETVLKILTSAAATERSPLCRLAAIEALGHFKDPRAVQGLIDAYYAVGERPTDEAGKAAELYAAGGLRLDELGSAFAPDVITRIQCQVMTSLGKTGHPQALELLTTVVKEPRAEGQARQQAVDVRIAAARALGNFSHYQATESLVRVLKEEKDAALRTSAHQSLQAATGKKLPPDARAWEELLQQGEQAAPKEPSGVQRVLGMFQGQ